MRGNQTIMCVYMEGKKLIQKRAQPSAHTEEPGEVPKLARHREAGESNSKCQEIETSGYEINCEKPHRAPVSELHKLCSLCPSQK